MGLMNIKNWEEAQKDFNKSLELDPGQRERAEGAGGRGTGVGGARREPRASGGRREEGVRSQEGGR
jgi:hypothetical protein